MIFHRELLIETKKLELMSEPNIMRIEPDVRVKGTNRIGEVIEWNDQAVEHSNSLRWKVRFSDGTEEEFHPSDLEEFR